MEAGGANEPKRRGKKTHTRALGCQTPKDFATTSVSATPLPPPQRDWLPLAQHIVWI